jgi:hypothetical protein
LQKGQTAKSSPHFAEMSPKMSLSEGQNGHFGHFYQKGLFLTPSTKFGKSHSCVKYANLLSKMPIFDEKWSFLTKIAIFDENDENDDFDDFEKIIKKCQK